MAEGVLFQGKVSSWMKNLSVRSFQTSNVANEASSSSDAKKTSSEVGPAKQKTVPPPHDNSKLPSSPRGIPTALDKKFLLWSGYYKTAEEIPRILDGDVIHRARSWGRIRINIGFLFLAAGLAGVMVYSGKQAAKRGESLEQQNLEWHRKINEEHRQKSNQK